MSAIRREPREETRIEHDEGCARDGCDHRAELQALLDDPTAAPESITDAAGKLLAADYRRRCEHRGRPYDPVRTAGLAGAVWTDAGIGAATPAERSRNFAGMILGITGMPLEGQR